MLRVKSETGLHWVERQSSSGDWHRCSGRHRVLAMAEAEMAVIAAQDAYNLAAAEANAAQTLAG